MKCILNNLTPMEPDKRRIIKIFELSRAGKRNNIHTYLYNLFYINM